MTLPNVNADAVSRRLPEENEWLYRDHIQFWEKYSPWLLERGYSLYPQHFDDAFQESTVKWRPPVAHKPGERRHPFAYIGNYDASDPSHLSQRSPPQFRPAQNRSAFDVMIKIVANNSEEMKIYRFLLDAPELHDSDRFPSVIPVLDILSSPHDFSFVVTPRWGDCPDTSLQPSSPRQLLRQFLSLLQGLCYLHAHKIVHRDITFVNVLQNYFTYGNWSCEDDFDALISDQCTTPIRYCWIDFDLAVKFPDYMPIQACRLHSSLACMGSPQLAPPDVLCGELHYDPFAYDVACLGKMFFWEYHERISVVPMLAPLIDGMTTDVASRRFTAHEAYKFCQEISWALTERPDEPFAPQKYNQPPESVWDLDLPADIRTRWPPRSPPPSLFIRVIRWIGWRSIWGLRSLRFLRRLWSTPSAPYITPYDSW